jgi:ribose transport system ATP-binding protein
VTGAGVDTVVMEARAISKSFPGVQALNMVHLRVYAAKVNAIVGENGAGKSTLMYVLSGVCADYEGDLLLDGRKVTFRDTTDARRAGISMIHQELQLVPWQSIAENIFLGREPLNSVGTIDFRAMWRKATTLLQALECGIDVRSPVSSLRIGQQQIVEIAKALSFDVRVLVMDEPTSALSKSETRTLFRLIRSLTAKGVAIIYITHKMAELTELADYVTVLRDGRTINQSAMRDLTVDAIVKQMVGRDVKDFYVKKEHSIGSAKLQIEGLSLRRPGRLERFVLNDISFTVNASEVLGLFGLMGAGRTELFETLFGLHGSGSSGTVRINGKQVSIHSPADAIRAGMALLPEDRKCDGLVLEMAIAQNISLASLDKVLTAGLLNTVREEKQADAFRDQLSIKSYSSHQKANQLSGGNQQKVVLSKWLVTNPEVLLLDEPTRGIDVNAKNEIYKLIDDLVSRGMAVVVASSELPEIMAIADRIVTLCEGRVTGMFARNEFSEEAILRAALPAN